MKNKIFVLGLQSGSTNYAKREATHRYQRFFLSTVQGQYTFNNFIQQLIINGTSVLWVNDSISYVPFSI